MPAWSFRSRFRAALSNGLAEAAGDPPPYPGIRPKRQTIRAERKDHRDPGVGVVMGIWLDQRTPGRVFLGETPPIRTRALIRIPHAGHVEVEEETYTAPAPVVILVAASVTKLARADGFETAEELFAFLGADHGFPFKGYRFRW